MNQTLAFIVQTCSEYYRSIIRFNNKTFESFIYKYDYVFSENPDEPIYTGNIIENFMKSGNLHPQDEWLFMLMKEQITHMKKVNTDLQLVLYRYKENGLYRWRRMNILKPTDFSDDNPYSLILIQDVDGGEAAFYESATLINNHYVRILMFDLKNDTFVNVHQSQSEKNVLGENKAERRFSDEIANIRERMIFHEDVEVYNMLNSFDRIKHYFDNGGKDYTFFYRRKAGVYYRWVRALIMRSYAYSEDNQLYFLFVEDSHEDVHRLMNINAISEYTKVADQDDSLARYFYENMQIALETFTNEYSDYFVIDLEKDRYINFKIRFNEKENNRVSIGSYSQVAEKLMNEMFAGDERQRLQNYASIEKIREMLRDNMTVEYSFDHPSGKRMKTTLIKSQSREGIPVKVICTTVEVKTDEILRVNTFGNFEAYGEDGKPIRFSRRQSKELLAYLIDKHGYPVSSKDIVEEMLEKDVDDLNAIKYVSTLIRRCNDDLAAAGFNNVLIKEQKTIRININALDCDYYHVLNGNPYFWKNYHNEYMKEYSWAEDTNAELQRMAEN